RPRPAPRPPRPARSTAAANPPPSAPATAATASNARTTGTRSFSPHQYDGIVITGWRFEHSYAALPPIFSAPAEPTAVPAPQLVAFNRPLATCLGLVLDPTEGPEDAAIFAGNRLPAGSYPIAQAYAGHQFGHFTVLGDGRAI